MGPSHDFFIIVTPRRQIMQHKGMPSSFALLALLVFLGPGTLNPRITAANFGLTIAGTYYVTQGDDPDFQIVTLTADGNWFSVNSGEMDSPTFFTNAQGVWERTGRQEITVKILDFSKDADGNVTGVVRLRYDLAFNEKLTEFSGEFFGVRWQGQRKVGSLLYPLTEGAVGSVSIGRHSARAPYEQANHSPLLDV
jgi:hypothetical protein